MGLEKASLSGVGLQGDSCWYRNGTKPQWGPIPLQNKSLKPLGEVQQTLLPTGHRWRSTVARGKEKGKNLPLTEEGQETILGPDHLRLYTNGEGRITLQDLGIQGLPKTEAGPGQLLSPHSSGHQDPGNNRSLLLREKQEHSEGVSLRCRHTGNT